MPPSSTPVKVWPVHITLSAEEFAAIQPRGGFGGFGGRPTPEGARKAGRAEAGRPPETSSGQNSPGAPAPSSVGDQTFEKIGIRYKGNGTIMRRRPDHQEVVQDRPRPGGRDGQVRRVQDDQPALRRDRPVEGPGDARLRTLPCGRGTRLADRPGRGAAHRAGKVRQGIARPLHGRRGGGQAVPKRPVRRRQGPADEAGGPARASTTRATTGRATRSLRAEAGRHGRRGEADDRVRQTRRQGRRRNVSQGDRVVPRRGRLLAVPGGNGIHGQHRQLLRPRAQLLHVPAPQDEQDPFHPVGPRSRRSPISETRTRTWI